MAFMTLKTIVLQNFKKINFTILVPFIICLLTSLVNYRPNMTLLLSNEDVKND